MTTLKTEETLLAIVDAYANGASYNQAARVSGVSKRTLWAWVAASRDGSDPALMIDLLGDGNVMTFERALVQARRMVHLEARSRLEKRALLGHEEPVFFQGQPTWKEDERCVGVTDPDIREMMGCARDGLMRDEQGRRVQHTIHVQPPVALALRVMEVAFDEYTPTTNVNSNVTTNPPTTGATRGTMPTQPPFVPAKPPLPLQLEILPAPVSETQDDPDLLDLLGPEPIQNADEPEPRASNDAPEPRGDNSPPETRGSQPATVVEQLGQKGPVDTGPMIVAPAPEPAPSTRPILPKLAEMLRRTTP